MRIFTKRLELTNFKSEYVEAFTKALSDPSVFLYLPERVPTIGDIEKLIQWFIERDSENSINGFKGTNPAIFHKKSKNLIGWCGIKYRFSPTIAIISPPTLWPMKALTNFDTDILSQVGALAAR